MSRYLDLLKLRGFRLYWLGFTVSYLGDELTKVAFVWYVYERTQSAEAVGWLMACFTAPIVVGGFLAGWVLDRFDRRLVLIVDSLLRGGVIALIPILDAAGMLSTWHLYAAASVHGLLLMIPLAGTPAMIPSLVPAERVSTANAMEMLGYTTGGVLGPVLGGLLIATLGAPRAVLLDVLTYLFFALCLWRLGPIAPVEARPITTRPRIGFGVVFALLVGSPILIATTLMFLVWNIGAGALAVWLPVLANEHLRGGPTLYGVLVALQTGGQMVGALAAGALASDGRLGLRICLIQSASGVVLLALALTGHTALAVGVALVLFGICAGPLTIWAQTLRMRIVPAEMRGRAFALLRMLMQGGRPIGGALGGLVVPLLGVLGAAGLSAALAGLPGLLGLLVRSLREALVPTTPKVPP